MDQQEPNPLRQEIIEIVAQGNTEKEQQSEIEELSSDYDELIPRPAFQIDLNNENLTEEEKDAMVYLLSVRNQKQSLILEKKLHIREISVKKEDQNIPSQLMPQQIMNNILNTNEPNEANLIQARIAQWKNQLVANWKCVVVNLQYIHKHKKQENTFRQKLTDQKLFQIPQAHKISSNKWLTLPQIQALIIDFSNFYLEMLEYNQSEPKRKAHYHLWIYSLLALHQSYASYTNFEALGSINACIERQFQNKMRSVQQKTTQNQTSIENAVIQWLTTLIILKQVFKQTYLGKYIQLLKKVKII